MVCNNLKSSNFEETKKSLKNTDKAISIKESLALNSIFEVLSFFVPGSGIIDSSISSVLERFQVQKRNELIEILRTSHNVTTEMISDVEFLINFKRTIEAIDRLSNNDKVVFFANLLKNGYLGDERIDYNEFEECFFALNSLSYREIRYLVFLYEYNLSHDVDSANKEKYMNDFGVAFGNEFGVGNTYYLDIYNKLCSTGFVVQEPIFSKPSIMRNSVNHPLSEDYSMSDIEIFGNFYYATNLLISFVERIKSIEVEGYEQ